MSVPKILRQDVIVHGRVGVGVAAYQDIPCNLYCGEGLHCDVMYVPVGERELLFRFQMHIYLPAIRIVRIEDAKEAGPPPETYFNVSWGGATEVDYPAGLEAKLVWWRWNLPE